MVGCARTAFSVNWQWPPQT